MWALRGADLVSVTASVWLFALKSDTRVSEHHINSKVEFPVAYESVRRHKIKSEYIEILSPKESS